TFSGSGKISGAIGLTKQGAGTLALVNTGGNNYTGPTVVSGGVLSVTNLANGGSPSPIGASSANPTNLVLQNSTFSYSGAPVSTDRGYSLQGTGSTIDAQGDLTFGGFVTAAAGSKSIKTGSAKSTYKAVGTNRFSSGPAAQPGWNVQAGTVVLDGTAGTQTNYVDGDMWVASTIDSAASLALTNTSLGISSWFALSRGNGANGFQTTAAVYNSTLSSANATLGYNNGLPNDVQPTLSLFGTSKMITPGIVTIGESAGARGVLNFNNSGTSVFSIGANTQLRAGGNDNSSGAINQNSGTLAYGNGGNYIELGVGGANAYGAYNLAGGALTTVSGSGFRVGFGGRGSYVQSGGALDCQRYFAIGGGGATGNGVATFMGGTANVVAGFRILLPDAGNATGVLNVGTEAGGSAVIAHGSTTGVVLVNSAGGNGTLNLNSGTLRLSGPIFRNQTGTATVNLNGGIVQAGANNVTLINNTPSSVNVYKGGVIFDSQTNTATVSATLLAKAGNGIYPSGGTLTISSGGGAGYIGAPLVTVSGGTGSGAMAVATVTGGAVANVMLTCPGQGYVAGDAINFAFAGGGSTTAASTFVYTLQAADLAANSAGGLTKVGSGTLTLSSINTYTGASVVSNGTLIVTGTVAGPAQVVAGTLAGTGTIKGAVTVASGATLSPGVSGIGTLSISNALTFAAGSTSAMEVSKTGSTKDLIQGVTTLTYGGTLAVTNLAGSLASGDSFKLFDATSYQGSFSTIVPATPGAGLVWNTNQLTVNGTLSIASSAAPTLNAAYVSGGNLILTGTGGSAGGAYTWLTSTNAAAPAADWTTNTTGVFSGGGSFSNAIPINVSEPARFFRLRTP
ncbi:MAG: Autotransporter-associated beta strand repeat protein, partial [Pedosphaera sp.]|nr:Autotransporter-associated beta strand repeat protein [Pedosphaera sp.]